MVAPFGSYTVRMLAKKHLAPGKLRSRWGLTGVSLGSHWGLTGVLLGSYWDLTGIYMGPIDDSLRIMRAYFRRSWVSIKVLDNSTL